MTIEIHFNDVAFKQQLMKATAEGLQLAGTFLAAQCKIAVNKPNPHHHVATLSPQASARRGGQKTAKVYKNMHNQYAGKPPFTRTGHGRDSIVSAYNNNPFMPIVRVGVRQNAVYMAYLELGTKRKGKQVIMPRPWLIATLMKHKETIARLALSKGKKR